MSCPFARASAYLTGDWGIMGQLGPLGYADSDRSLGRGDALREQGEGLSESGCGRCEDAMKFELMGGPGDFLARAIVVDGRDEVCVGQPNRNQMLRVGEVKHKPYVHGYGVEHPWPDRG